MHVRSLGQSVLWTLFKSVAELTVTLCEPGSHSSLSITLFISHSKILWPSAQWVWQLKLCAVDGLGGLCLFARFMCSLSFAQSFEDVESICKCIYEVVYAIWDIAFLVSLVRLFLCAHRHIFNSCLSASAEGNRSTRDKAKGILECVVALLSRY